FQNCDGKGNMQDSLIKFKPHLRGDRNDRTFCKPTALSRAGRIGLKEDEEEKAEDTGINENHAK
ncbi:unnamed protein product, partial [Ceratitis capitata]